MKIHDISMTIHKKMAVYGNADHKRPKLTNSANFDNASYYETELAFNMHTGTHIDAPLHMIKNGETMECYDVERFIAKAKVIDLSHIVEKVTKEDLVVHDIQKGDFVLLKTKNSFDIGFNTEFVFLEASGAEYLKDLGVTGVGIDCLGIERSQPDHFTHQTLLGAGIMILEGLELKHIKAGAYQLIVLPLKIQGVEASPARAILIEE